MKYYTAAEAIAELNLAIVPEELEQLAATANLEELQKLGLSMDGDRHAKSEPYLVRLPLKKKAKKAKKVAETEKVDEPEEVAHPPVNPYKIDWSSTPLVISLMPIDDKVLVAIGISNLPPLVVEFAENLLALQELTRRAKSQAMKRQIQWNLRQKNNYES